MSLTLTRRVGERIRIGPLTVEVVELKYDTVVLRLFDVPDESAVELPDETVEIRPSKPRRRRSRREREAPVVVEVRRSGRRSS